MEEIAKSLHISHGSVSTTLHDRLGMHKLTAHWVPKSLSDEQMATRASVYSALLKRFRSKEDDFLSRLVTVDETWVHITKTYLYNFDPFKPHFYIVKLGFTGVYIIFLISAQKHRLWLLVRTASARRF